MKVWVKWKAGGNDKAVDGNPRNTWRHFQSEKQAADFHEVNQGDLAKVRKSEAPELAVAWDVRNEKPDDVDVADIVNMTDWSRSAPAPAATAREPPTKRQRTEQSPGENNPLEQAQSDLKKDKVLEFKGASEQQYQHKITSRDSLDSDLTKARATVTDLETELGILRKEVKAKEKLEKEAIAERDKLQAAWAAAKRDIQTLKDRKCTGRTNEPLDGIYVDLVGQFKLDEKIRDVFDAKKKKSPIYVGTAEGPGVNAAKRRKHSHDKTYGIRGNNNSAIMRLIHVTDYAHAGEAEQYCIRQLKAYAKVKKQPKDVKNENVGGGGIHKGKPYHFIYIYYTPQEK